MKHMHTIYLKTIKVLLIFTILTLYNYTSLTAQENPIILVLLDCSRSMLADVQGKSEFQQAKQIINELIENKKEFNYCLITFGKNDFNNPEDIELTVIPFPNMHSKILAEISKIGPKGLSPIAGSLIFQAMF